MRDDEEFWRTHCWFQRFDGLPCARPATWRGPNGDPSQLTRAWRACDAHRMTTDEPLADAQLQLPALAPQEREGESR